MKYPSLKELKKMYPGYINPYLAYRLDNLK